MNASSKKIEILDFAQELIQIRGYNGFSFADIALKVGIRKASIHHYFPSKDDLCLAVIRRYKELFKRELERIGKEKSRWLDKISAYTKLYENTLTENRFCLCGMLASDIETLPRLLKKEIREFFSENAAWIMSQLHLHFKKMTTKRLNEVAWQIISSLQGALILSRMADQPEIFFASTKELYAQLERLK